MKIIHSQQLKNIDGDKPLKNKFAKLIAQL